MKRPSIIEFDTRMSIARGRRGTLINLQRSRGSIWNLSGTGKKSLIPTPVQYENSYRLMPTNNEKFIAKAVQKVVIRVLHDSLTGIKYDSKMIPDLTKQIADRIKRLVKDMTYNRFKLVCFIFIGNKTGANISIGSRCLWHPDNGDTVAEATFETGAIYAVGTVYGLYFE